MRYLIIISLTLIMGFKYVKGQQQINQKYLFGKFAIETDTCKIGASIKVSEMSKVIYKECFQDANQIIGVDTINLNSHRIQNFVYCCEMEEYSVVGVIISDKEKVYRNVDVIYVFSPEIYSNIKLGKNEIIKEFILKDVDGDKKQDIITNVIFNGKEFKTIKGQSDTITYKKLLKILNQKDFHPISRGVFLDSNKYKKR
jgi:hypothetical protein